MDITANDVFWTVVALAIAYGIFRAMKKKAPDSTPGAKSTGRVDPQKSGRDDSAE